MANLNPKPTPCQVCGREPALRVVLQPLSDRPDRITVPIFAADLCEAHMGRIKLAVEEAFAFARCMSQQQDEDAHGGIDMEALNIGRRISERRLA